MCVPMKYVSRRTHSVPVPIAMPDTRPIVYQVLARNSGR